MLIVHRDFLVEQSRASMLRDGINPDDIGIIKAGYREERDRPIQIAGLQSLQKRATPENLDLIILDECHSTAFFSHYQKIKQESLNAIHLGFSASPWRLKSTEEYFGLHFDSIVQGPSISELIERGFLSPFRCFGYGGLVDITKLDKNKSGEFSEDQMQSEFIKAEVPQKVVKQILELCDGRTGIIFNAGVKQSKLQTELLNAAGIPAVHLEAKTPFKERQVYFDKLASGEIRVISSIGCLTEGFDVPSIGFVAIARATTSRALYVQMGGRGLRIFPNKTDCLLLDFGGNVKRLGYLTDNFPITLEPTPKPEADTALKECPNCDRVISIFAQICPHCGYEFTDGENKKEENTDLFEQEFGELFDKKTLEKVRYARSQCKSRFTKKQPPDKLWDNFNDKYNIDGKTFLCNDWLFGAIFGGNDNDYNRQRFLEYLEQFAIPNKNKEAWIKHHLELEFGKPGKQYRTGKKRTTEAKMGCNIKLEWWEILQCNPWASWEEIKINYRELAKVYHPDSSGFDSETEMKLLNLAFDKAKARFRQ